MNGYYKALCAQVCNSTHHLYCTSLLRANRVNTQDKSDFMKLTKGKHAPM